MPHSQVSIVVFMVFFHLVFMVPIVHSFMRLTWCILLTLSTVPLPSLHIPFFVFFHSVFIVYIVHSFMRLSWCILHIINETKNKNNIVSVSICFFLSVQWKHNHQCFHDFTSLSLAWLLDYNTYRVAQNKPDYLLLLSKFCISTTKYDSMIMYV